MTNSTKKTIFGLSCFFILFWGCEEVLRRKIGGFAGSYPFVEKWDLKATESELKDIIKEIKVENPELKPPGDSSFTFKKSTYWCHTNFYYKDSKELVHTWIRGGSNTTTSTLALVGFSPIDNYKARKLINRDFWYVANKIEIAKFKRLILEKINEKIIDDN